MCSAADTRWTTVNFAEAIQGVQTPLGWTFWSYCMETSVRRSFAALGTIPAAEVPVPDDSDGRLSGIFFGRAAGNINTFRRIGDAIPGFSGDAIELQLFGEIGVPGTPPRPGAWKRYPIVAIKMPLVVIRSPKQIPRLLKEYRAWWGPSVIDHPPIDLQSAQQLLRDSAQRFVEIGFWHGVVTMVVSGLFEQVQSLATKAYGSPRSALDLVTGYGGMEETDLLSDLWAVAHESLSMQVFLSRHGFHGPDEGQLPARPWRDDPTPISSLLQSYKNAGDPRAREPEQLARRLRAEARLLKALPAWRRPAARLVLTLARNLIPLREQGKAAFLLAIDGARCAARAAGGALAQSGQLADPEDVFLLTYDELAGTTGEDWRALVVQRRREMAAFETVTVGPTWQGQPEPAAVSADPRRFGMTRVSGIGVVGERVTGVARVVTDPRDVDLEDGEILVCRTTDPSWTPLFMVAAALVIDTGGAMSHGAIVARELGVTCIINTVTGTRDIPDGATITVDGSAGTVDIHI
jgi:pyruvate,water dikinase